MANIQELLMKYTNAEVAIYGLGTETERFLSEYGRFISVVGLLDGFREEGEIYGHPIIPISATIDKGVSLIIVVARPGSCKAIAKRIGSFCRTNDISLFDVRGKDLLVVRNVTFDFSHIKGESKEMLYKRIHDAGVVSFDLFDTLITRRVLSNTDVFDLVDKRLYERGIVIPDFSGLRLYAEKELSKETAPKLIDIYDFVLKKSGGNFISAEELAYMEFEVDLETIITRTDMCEVFQNTVRSGKKVVITTDSYYTISQIESILEKVKIKKPDKVVVSCEYGTSKTQKLFEELSHEYSEAEILHIGDDGVADIAKASGYGFYTYRVYSGRELFESLGELGLEEEIRTLSDRMKVGLLVSNLFNSPFWFEGDAEKLSISSPSQVGYLFCAPMITDFVLWMKDRLKEGGFHQILFCARDGYLPGKLFKEAFPDMKSLYFLSSRTAAIRAGMENFRDIAYVDSMKYFGTAEEELKSRFGIVDADRERLERSEAILLKAEVQKENYKKYIAKLDLDDSALGMFDFVAKGTTQMYLGRLFLQHIKGFYFLQLEPEFMADKGLDIKPFYSDEEKNDSAIFDNYYILETVLTSPYAQIEEFDKNGNPVFAEETRSDIDIEVIEKAQAGIREYFREYMRLLPENIRIENKKLDEKMLALIHQIQITDEDFMDLQVEDPFFGRMTRIKDIIG